MDCSETHFTFFSLNVNHMSNCGGLLLFLKQYRPHIVALQEISLSSENLSSLVQRYGYKAFVSRIDSRPGVGFVYHQSLGVLDILPLEPGRLLQLKVDEFLTFINIYAPSGSQGRAARRTMFTETLLRNLKPRHSQPILLGDFNCVLDRKDTLGNFENKNCPALSELVRLFSYSDIFRILHGSALEFTYSNPGSFPSRLDRVYFPPAWISNLVSVRHHASLSDHKFVFVKIKHVKPMPASNFQSHYWKLNTSVLKDEDFMPNFEFLWRHLVEKTGTFSSISDWWEDCAKRGMVHFLKKFSRMKAEYRKSTRDFLFFSLDWALASSDWEEVSKLRARISNMIREELCGYTIRSRDSAHAEEERGSLYHVAREVKQCKAGAVNKLSVNNDTLDNDSEVEAKVTQFFSALFNGHHRTVDGHSEPVDTGHPFIPD